MKYVLLSAFDALLERSMPLQCVQPMTDEDIIESHRRAVLGGSFKQPQIENLVIFKYGYFDDIDGTIEILDKPVKLCALSQFLPRIVDKPVEVQKMPNNEVKVRKIAPNNFVTSPVTVVKGIDMSSGKREVYHLDREGNGLKVVSDGIVDHHELIQSEACNAGLENIIRLQTMRYGTIENAILRNKEKQTFADVSHIPTTVAEQAEYIKDIQNDVDNLCSKLGISKEELLKSNQQFLSDKLAELNKAADPAPTGGNE